MPHASTGTQHACPGASGPVTLRNKNVIPAGNCNIVTTDGYRWCRRHENLCKKHDWVYSKKDECQMCQEEKAAKKKKKEEDDQKRKRDKDDGGKKTPNEASGRKNGKNVSLKKPITPSTRKTRSTTAAEGAVAAGIPTQADHWHFWMSGKKIIDLDKLLNDTIAQPDDQLSACVNDPHCALNKLTQQHADILAAIRPHLCDLPDLPEST
ncbi:uncharacterized protein RCO7_10469 [Rhynchosporium graminicola]|uniref:Uncharacterized protein n=1 Tax=Rhynchosporium graminicola TaxID=2792576 RepID=A0A1E1LP14_9HELO|nr:uncharacterized protein RCO7_10469 [Rhynchosporium commune]